MCVTCTNTAWPEMNSSVLQTLNFLNSSFSLSDLSPLHWDSPETSARNPRGILNSSFNVLWRLNFGKFHLLNCFHNQFLPWTTTNTFLGQASIVCDWSCAMTSLLIVSQPCLFGTNFHSASRETSKIQAFLLAHEVPNLASTKPLQPLLPPPSKPSHCYSDKGSTNPHFYSQPRFLSAPKALRAFLAPSEMNSAMAPQFPSLFKLLGILNYTTLVASSPRNLVGPPFCPSVCLRHFVLIACIHTLQWSLHVFGLPPNRELFVRG